MFGMLKGKKTYVAAAVTVIGAAASYVTGEANAMQAAQLAATAILAACLRNGLR